MKFCSKCGKEIMDEAVICPNCGCSVTGAGKNEVNVGLCILSALFPLFGIIYWPVKYKSNPKAATACGITAIVSWVACMILVAAVSAMQ